LPSFRIVDFGPSNHVQQIFVSDWLGEEINRAGLHGTHACGNVAFASEKDNRPLNIPGGQNLLQRQAIET